MFSNFRVCLKRRCKRLLLYTLTDVQVSAVIIYPLTDVRVSAVIIYPLTDVRVSAIIKSSRMSKEQSQLIFRVHYELPPKR